MAMSLPNQQLPEHPQQSNHTQPLVERLGRQEFIGEVFAPHYDAGEHVTIVGPTGCGKTTICFELLDAVASPDLPAVVLVKKPRDDVVKQWAKLSGFKKTESWPPVIRRGFRKKSGGFLKKRRGWIFWPRHDLQDIDKDTKTIAEDFRRAINECYRKGDRILFIDDLVGFSKELGLESTLKIVYMEGRAMGCGLWGAIQRPYEAPVIMYGAANHLILFKDPDKRSIDRFKDIGGVDRDLVANTVNSLTAHEFLYIGRTMADDGVSPALAIIERS